MGAKPTSGFFSPLNRMRSGVSWETTTTARRGSLPSPVPPFNVSSSCIGLAFCFVYFHIRNFYARVHS